MITDWNDLAFSSDLKAIWKLVILSKLILTLHTINGDLHHSLKFEVSAKSTVSELWWHLCWLKQVTQSPSKAQTAFNTKTLYLILNLSMRWFFLWSLLRLLCLKYETAFHALFIYTIKMTFNSSIDSDSALTPNERWKFNLFLVAVVHSCECFLQIHSRCFSI